MPISEMIIVWTIACGEATVDVYEDGRVDSADERLMSRVRAHLTEPVDVSNTGAGGTAMVLQPSDRRYVVARVRRLVADAPDLEIVGLRFAGES